MEIDREYLRQHYAALSDEALMETNRADLVEAAQQLYDDELQRRQLNAVPVGPTRVYSHDLPHRGPSFEADEKPEWLDEGAEVYSSTIQPGHTGTQEAADAADALRSAGIPCYLEISEIPQQAEATLRSATHQWRLLVPGKLNLRATSVLDEEIFNPDVEAEWKALLEGLSDSELSEMDPQIVYAGLFDRVERITRAYEEELLRRGQR